MDHHQSECDEDSPPESISDSENWDTWNGDLNNPNKSEDNCEAEDQSDLVPGNGITASEGREHHVVSAKLNVPGLIRPTQRRMKQTEKWLVTVSATETKRNKGNKTQ